MGQIYLPGHNSTRCRGLLCMVATHEHSSTRGPTGGGYSQPHFTVSRINSPSQPGANSRSRLSSDDAFVAQRIEHAPPKRGMQVRFLPGASTRFAHVPCYGPPRLVSQSTLEAPPSATTPRRAGSDESAPAPWTLRSFMRRHGSFAFGLSPIDAEDVEQLRRLVDLHDRS